MEIGPGFTYKIAAALAELDFRGSLYLVEPNREASRWVTRRYRDMLPGVRVVPITAPLAEAAELLPSGVEALLMNHVLDDLVLDAALPLSRRQAVFGNMRYGRSHLPEVRQTWRRLLADRRELGRLTRRVLDELCALLAAKDHRVIGASQYESWILSRQDLGPVNRIAQGLLSQLAERAGRTRPQDRKLLRAMGQDPRRWLIVDRSTSLTEVRCPEP